MKNVSELQKARSEYKPKLPKVFADGPQVRLIEGKPTSSIADQEMIKTLFPNTYGMPIIQFEHSDDLCSYPAMKVGVILSGGQAPGGHNVIAGIYDSLIACNADSRLYGFLGGPSGLVDNEYIEITEDIINEYRNTGGFDIIGSGRTKLETDEQFEISLKNCLDLGIGTLVIIGGDDSNTNAGILAEYFADKNSPVSVMGVPKTIDGDMKNEYIEASFGFDTATKVYSELIGNIERDALSAKKYWHFVKLMGRSASHIALECALKTHANITIISEEVEAKKQTLADIVEYIAQIVAKRSANKENFGVALIPEGLIEFIPEMKKLISELNELMSKYETVINDIYDMDDKREYISGKLSLEASHLYSTLPEKIAEQLIMDRDPHGNVQVSLIETEKLLGEMVSKRLSEMKMDEQYSGSFRFHSHFLGYEGRCAAPSNFDADYTYTLGYIVPILAANGKTGYISSARNLENSSENWIAGGIPLTMLLNMEHRHGQDKPVIKKALVELEGLPFKTFQATRKEWAEKTFYCFPGPIQYFGPKEVVDITTKTIQLEK